MLSSNTNVERTTKYEPIDLTNLPDAQLMLECRFYKADTKLYIDIATNFHAMHSYQFPFHWAYLTGHNKIDEKLQNKG